MIDRIRAQFPALDREVNGERVAYFDGPGGTQVPAAVADAVRAYLLEHNANEGWNYPTSHETDALLAAGRAAIADLFGARSDEIAFGQNMTTLTLRLSRALGREIEPGDRVVVTELDHHANVDPWKALADERGAEIRVVRMEPSSGTLDLDDLHDALSGPTRILAIGAASNALGTISDVADAAARARAAGATVFVDAVHYAPHELVDVRALGADFVAASPYKFYGPHLGVLWGPSDAMEALRLPRVASAPNHAPERFETGTISFEAVAGATAAVDFMASLGGEGAGDEGDGRRARLRAAYGWLHGRGEALFLALWEGMNAIPGVRTFGPAPGAPRTPTLGFAIAGVDPREAVAAYAESALFVTHGDFYATSVIERLGYRGRGILRAGCVAYTSEEEVRRLVDATARVAARSGARATAG